MVMAFLMCGSSLFSTQAHLPKRTVMTLFFYRRRTSIETRSPFTLTSR